MDVYPNIDNDLDDASPYNASITFTQKDVVHQVYTLPWPLKGRDFVLERKFEFLKEYRSLTIKYRSIYMTAIFIY